MALSRADDYWKSAAAFLAKADGRDKLLATLQYAAMVAAAGEAGKALSVQKNLGAARKPFRILKPVEVLVPLLLAPAGPLTPLALLGKIKALSMAAFFGFDHVVWAGGAGLVSDKSLVERAQKISFYGWLLGSLCQLSAEVAELAKLRAARAKACAAAPAGQAAPDAAADAALRARALAAAGVATQAALAASLLGLLPLKPRAIGALGVTTSAIACWQLLPPLPKAAKAKEV